MDRVTSILPSVRLGWPYQERNLPLAKLQGSLRHTRPRIATRWRSFHESVKEQLGANLQWSWCSTVCVCVWISFLSLYFFFFFAFNFLLPSGFMQWVLMEHIPAVKLGGCGFCKKWWWNYTSWELSVKWRQMEQFLLSQGSLGRNSATNFALELKIWISRFDAFSHLPEWTDAKRQISRPKRPFSFPQHRIL